MTAITRIYLVKEQTGKDTVRRLVRTTSQAAAIKHVTEPRFSAAVATPDELVTATLAGTKVEDAAS